MRWEYLLPGEFEDAVKKAKGVCVIPVGAMERHGTHLPLGCDALKGIAFTNAAADIAEVVSCPGAPYFGDMADYQDKGNICFPIPLIWQIMEALCDECYNNGFTKIVFVASHGGNKPMLDAFMRQIRWKNPDYAVYHYYQKMGDPAEILKELDKYPYLTEEDIAVFQSYVDEGKYGGHGCFKETSCIYHLYPELVALDKIGEVDGLNQHRSDEFEKLNVYSAYRWNLNFPNNYAAFEHPGMNERTARAIAEKTIADTAAAFKLIKEDDLFHQIRDVEIARAKARRSNPVY